MQFSGEKKPSIDLPRWRRAQQASTGRDETGLMDSTHHPRPAAPVHPRRHRPRQPVKRPRTIRFALTDEEFSQVAAPPTAQAWPKAPSLPRPP